MSVESEKQRPQHSADEHLFGAVHTVLGQLAAIETFMVRRFNEISCEINATAQQVGMAEEGLERRFSEILDVIAAIAHSGDGQTPANAGVELDAVVGITEDAANRIMDAAGRISTRMGKAEEWHDEARRETAIADTNKDLEEIFLACSFQDLTGQRIRKTLDNLKLIEERLGAVLERLGIHIKPGADNPALPKHYAVSQQEIDSLFAAHGKAKS
jgi:chemotaxis protein CheZ